MPKQKKTSGRRRSVPAFADTERMVKELRDSLTRSFEALIDPSLNPGLTASVRWEDGMPMIINQAEIFGLKPRLSKEFTLNKYHRRMLLLMLEAGSMSYFELCEKASGVDNCKEADSQRWRKVSRSLAYLWAHQLIKTKESAMAQLSVEGWVVAMELNEDGKVQQVRAPDAPDAAEA